MAEFPSSINTQTSSPPQLNNIVLLGLPVNVSHLRSVSGLMSIAQLVFGMLVWSIDAGIDYDRFRSFGWLLFVSLVFWIFTFNLLLCQVFSLFSKLPQVPWQLLVTSSPFLNSFKIIFSFLFFQCEKCINYILRLFLQIKLRDWVPTSSRTDVNI
uniref:MARVEL domain-containing protein n=1 Tax=Eptatretus burgeri TaxID=7764 RepID=A0A8C4QJ14_EPTBU